MFSRLIALAFILFSSFAGAATTRILLDYSYGNQIRQHRLVILNNGLAMTAQGQFGRMKYLPDNQLKAETLEALVKAIDDAVTTGIQVEKDGHPTLLGSSSGQLKVFPSDGLYYPAALILRNSKVGGPDKVYYQTGKDAKWIRDLVAKFWPNTLPEDLFTE